MNGGWVIFIMGVSGSGKTTVGRLLAKETGMPFFDGDDFHSTANKEKMKAGIPLTDEDRLEWLQQLNVLATEQGRSKGAVIACSALKEKYRTILGKGIQQLQWIFLKGDYELILGRVQQRKDHYMPPSLLRSQFDALEIPPSAITVDIDQPVTAMLQQIRSALPLN
jgi:carbohydrate kinase (thermoresistant glucokinase family)